MITPKKLEELCIRYLDTLDPERAYSLCGLEGDAAVEGVRLLSGRAAKKILKRLTDPDMAYVTALGSLMKLAYGRRGEVLNQSAPDLFCVSEYKRTKDGGEVKYISRLDAIEKLCELCQNGEANRSAESFFEALSNMSPSDVGE